MDATAARTENATRRHWFLAGLCLFFLAINLQYVVKVVGSERGDRSAFLRWSGQILKLDDGVDIWDEHAWPNPPIMALILRPFVRLGGLPGSLLWFYAKVAMAVVSIHWVIKLLDTRDRPFPFWGKVLAVVLSLRPIEGDLVHGNVNLFILFLVTGSLYAFCRHRDLLAGVLLGLAIACKVTPLLFVPYFVWKRAWKTLLGTALGLGLFVVTAPGLVLGWGDNATFLASWWRQMVHPYAVEGKITSEHQNQSLPGLMQRLLTESPSFAEYDGLDRVPVEYHNLVSLDQRMIPWLLKGCMAGFALLVAWRCRAPTDDRRGWRLVAEFGLVALGMLLFSERTWKHHGVVLLLPFSVLAYTLTAYRWPWRLRWYQVGTLAGVVVLMTLTSSGLSDRHERIGDLAQVYGAYVWGYTLLVAALLVLLGRPDPPPARPVDAAGAATDGPALGPAC